MRSDCLFIIFSTRMCDSSILICFFFLSLQITFLRRSQLKAVGARKLEGV